MFHRYGKIWGICLVAVMVMNSPAKAQRGMGDSEGVARQATLPEIVVVSGRVTAIEREPCQQSTGRAAVGAHLLLAASDDLELNIHLGPAPAVAFALKELAVGDEISAHVFRTDKMPENHFVAQVLEVDGEPFELRDADLRPVWAGGGPVSAWERGGGRGDWGRGGPPSGGFGRGRGRGPGWGNQMGRGRRGWSGATRW
jgi:hypothetical protein